jgi:putative DNA primase/helicase
MLPDIHEMSRGRWRGILSHFGLSQRDLSGKHGPCPACQDGTDRFRFDDKDGRGTWICSQCGAGSGVDLVMKMRGWDFKDAVAAIRPVIGGAAAEPVNKGMSDTDKRKLRVDLWQSSRSVQKGDPVDQYLTGRNVGRAAYWPCLRYAPDCRYSRDQSFPAMIAAIQDADGRGVSLHRTFLKDGDKAPVDNPRMMMPGTIPMGSAIRLGEISDHMGIAEGIETAMAASYEFGLPTWAALNANLLAEWEPPQGVTEVTIYGDNDANYTGQAAAYQLARRLTLKKIKANVLIPATIGEDWADMLETAQ